MLFPPSKIGKRPVRVISRRCATILHNDVAISLLSISYFEMAARQSRKHQCIWCPGSAPNALMQVAGHSKPPIAGASGHNSNLSLYTTTAVILLDSDGHRLIAKYFDPPHIGNPSSNNNEPNKKNPSSHGLSNLGFPASVPNFEPSKIKEHSSIPFGIKHGNQLGENELMLQTLLNSFFDALSLLLRNQVEKRAVLENLDLVSLCLDEMVDDGIILETDSVAIASRVSRPKADAGVGVNLSDITINEQTIMQAFSNLRDKAAQRLLQGSL
ncbi:hypothetical protein PSHT_09003 [Puccinia striiformis]|uniref:Coatomer subunit zeta n=1 Tax=Puccinia striiformis TaxID=27350 RepID=A0A2S4VJI7_9BASI|nr:hypothetical protein PSHT_09003 [Puccinia striiformis]